MFNPLMSIAPTLKKLLEISWFFNGASRALRRSWSLVSIPYCTTNELNVISHILKLLITEQQVRDCLVKSTLKTVLLNFAF